MSAVFLAAILRCFVGFVLLAACAGKLRDLARFRANLHASFGVSERAGALLAPGVIGTELLVALLVLGPFPHAGMAAAWLLFTAFTILLAWRMARDGALRCGCFGEAERNLSGYDLLRNLLIVAAIALFLMLPVAGAPALPPAAIVLAAGVAAILAVLAIDFHDVMHLLRAT